MNGRAAAVNEALLARVHMLLHSFQESGANGYLRLDIRQGYIVKVDHLVSQIAENSPVTDTFGVTASSAFAGPTDQEPT